MKERKETKMGEKNSHKSHDSECGSDCDCGSGCGCC